MAKKRETDELEYESYTISREALMREPKSQVIAPYITEYNFSNSQSFLRFIYSQSDKVNGRSLRAEVWIHDSETDLMVKVFHNPERPKFPGVTIGRLKEIIANGPSRGLRKIAPVKGLSRIDFFKVWIHEPKPDGTY
jgi:hypothetical protein